MRLSDSLFQATAAVISAVIFGFLVGGSLLFLHDTGRGWLILTLSGLGCAILLYDALRRIWRRVDG
jgi:hypothetical protein